MPLGKNPALRRYNLRIGLFMGSYVVLLVAANLVLKAHPLSALGRSAVAVVPAVPLLAVFWAIGRLVVELRDEYQRDRFVRQILWATAATLAINTVWGFIESVGGLPHMNPFYTATIWFAALGVGAVYRWTTER